MEKQLRIAHFARWIVVCNELNLLKPETIELLMKLLDAGLCLIGTGNSSLAGSGRQPLLPAIKNRLQVFYLKDYNRHQLIWFARNRNLQEGALLADMFLALRDYQTQYQLPVANPRHYFRWLEALVKLPRNKRPVAVIAQHLLKAACNPLLRSQEGVKPGQLHAVEYVLRHVPAKSFPKARSTFKDTNKLIMVCSNPQIELKPTPPASSSDLCLLM